MDSGLSFNIKLLNSSLSVHMYDNILENIESIMSIDYSEKLSLKIIVRNYLGLSSYLEDVGIDVVISNKDDINEVVDVTLCYYNGILYSVAYKSNLKDSIYSNLSVIDNEDKHDIIKNRLGVLYMVLDDSINGKEYKGTYKKYSETLIIKNDLHNIEHRYIIEDGEVVSGEEVMISSVNVFHKTNNINKLKHKISRTEDFVEVTLLDFLRYLIDVIGEYNG